MLHPMSTRPKGQQEPKGMEHTVFHSGQETTAAPSCPNICQAFKLNSYIQSVLFAVLGCFGWLVVGLGFPLLNERYQKFIQHYDNETTVRN